MNGVPARLCPACGAADPLRTGQPVWPLAWICPACKRGLAKSGGIVLFAPELADTVSGFDPASFSKLARVEADHFWFVARNELITGLANRFFPHAHSFLEIGCGSGNVLRALKASRHWEHLAGSDLHPSGLAIAKSRLPEDVELVQMDARSIPASGVFDVIGAFDVLEHVAEDEAVLCAVRGALKPGGGAIFSMPQHPWLWSRADELAYHQRRYRRAELEEKLRRNGFEIIFSSSFTTLLLPLMAASRLHAQHSDSAVDSEFAIHPAVNTLLKGILQAEVWLTLAGMRWPIGGSRVIAARAI
jgi:SAM-dependent methyltransferase